VGRFAYALVLPAMQQALGLSYSQAGFLGSANTAGYFLGALFSHRVLERIGYRRGFYGALVLQSISLLLLALTPQLTLLLLFRFAQGVLGALVFVGGAALLLASGGRGATSGLYFGGVGWGILLSPVVLLASGWRLDWALLAALSLLMTLAARVAPQLTEPEPQASGEAGSLRPIALLLLAYGLYGAGYIGYMTFVTSSLAASTSIFWAVLGVGALLNGPLWGRWIERVGGIRGAVHVLIVLTAASLFPLLHYVPWLSAFAFGLSFLGLVTAITQAFSGSLPPSTWARAMGLATAIFALGQALGPTLGGLAADLSGSAAGALDLASALLLLALLSALAQLRVQKRRKQQRQPG
jgi:predicted MFS family arabinose efflux permease